MRAFRHFPDASSANLTRCYLSAALINLDRDGATGRSLSDANDVTRYYRFTCLTQEERESGKPRARVRIIDGDGRAAVCAASIAIAFRGTRGTKRAYI